MFSFFAQFWVLAFFLHHSEDWEPVSVTVLGMLLLLWVNRVKDRAFPFFLCVMFYTGYTFSKSPHLANHSNYYLVICFCLLLWMVGSWYRNQDISDRFLVSEFLGLRPIICLSLFVVYWMAGIHKFNADFFNPDVSCASDFFLRYAREYHFDKSLIPRVFLDYSPHLVVFVELAGAALLLFPRTQFWGVISFVGLHSYLVPLSFYDFASICYSILLCFLPLKIFEGSENLGRLQSGMNFLVATAVVGSVVARFMTDYQYDRWIYSDVAQGWFFLAGSFYFMWQIVLNLRSEGLRLKDIKGVHLFDFKSMSPRWMFIMPVALAVYTNTSYLGLRTAGNTSMFSNLRTEGGKSNHFIFGSSWQPFGFQKDLILVKDIDPDFAGYMRRQPRAGMMMTTFELRRLIEMWRQDGVPVPMSFEYQGETQVFPDVTNSEWAGRPLPWLAKKLMLFREIQPEGPNECRW